MSGKDRVVIRTGEGLRKKSAARILAEAVTTAVPLELLDYLSREVRETVAVILLATQGLGPSVHPGVLSAITSTAEVRL